MKRAAKTPLRYAADCAEHLLFAARSAKVVEHQAGDRATREQARKVKAVAFELRKIAREMEASL